MGKAPTIAITMAGFGARFRDAGYDRPKYMIEARGRTLFDWSLRGLDRFVAAGAPFIFVVRDADAAEAFIRARAKAHGIGAVEIVGLDAPTDGQATTALIAANRTPSDSAFAVFNIDTSLRPGLLDPSAARGAGWIPCFDAPGDAWSFVRLDAAGRAVEVREKERISRHATIGFYWFRSAALYREAYAAYYGVAGREERGERYIAPLYNQLIADGKNVFIAELPFAAVTPLGTPDELRRFSAEDESREPIAAAAEP